MSRRNVLKIPLDKNSTKLFPFIIKVIDNARLSYDEYPNPVGFPIKDEQDLKTLTIPDPDAEYRFDKIKHAMQEFGDGKAIIWRRTHHFFKQFDPFGNSQRTIKLGQKWRT